MLIQGGDSVGALQHIRDVVLEALNQCEPKDVDVKPPE